MHEHPFNRLVQGVDELAAAHGIRDVFIQTGYSTYRPAHCQWKQAVDFEEFERLIEQAEIVITHGGAGSIAGALERNKPTIAVARLKRFGEHNNDHQLELIGALEQAGRILAVRDMSELPGAIDRARTFRPAQAGGQNRVVELLRDFFATCQVNR
jgi:UDP-N-acetylglucosamine transferase subunit ALG13